VSLGSFVVQPIVAPQALTQDDVTARLTFEIFGGVTSLWVPVDPIAFGPELLPLTTSETVPPPVATTSVVLTVVVVVGVNRTVSPDWLRFHRA
jgi:hypothetical protein